MTTAAAPAPATATPRLAGLVTDLSAAISVADIDVALSWYRNNLGLETLVRVDLPAAQSTVAYVTGHGIVLEIVARTGSTPAPRATPPDNYLQRGIAQLSFSVSDLDAAYAAAKAQGLHVETAIIDAPALGVRVFYVQDPDRNHVEFAQHRPSGGLPRAVGGGAQPAAARNTGE